MLGEDTTEVFSLQHIDWLAVTIYGLVIYSLAIYIYGVWLNDIYMA